MVRQRGLATRRMGHACRRTAGRGRIHDNPARRRSRSGRSASNRPKRMSTLAAPLPSNPVPLRDDARTIGLIGLAHGTSHFFHMLLPPLFPAFAREFSLTYSELGLL